MTHVVLSIPAILIAAIVVDTATFTYARLGVHGTLASTTAFLSAAFSSCVREKTP
jgi:hypothetical protein